MDLASAQARRYRDAAQRQGKSKVCEGLQPAVTSAPIDLLVTELAVISFPAAERP